MDKISLNDENLRLLFKPIQLPEGSVKTFIIKSENTNNIPDHFGFRTNIGELKYTKKRTKCHEIETELLMKSWHLRIRVDSECEIIGKLIYNNKVLKKNVNAPCIVMERVKKDLIKTSAGMVRLIGPPLITKHKSINKNFYKYWMLSGGFPIAFKDLLRLK